MILKVNDSVLAEEDKLILTEVVVYLLITFAVLLALSHSKLQYCSISVCGTSLKCHLVFVHDAEPIWHVSFQTLDFHFV